VYKDLSVNKKRLILFVFFNYKYFAHFDDIRLFHAKNEEVRI